MNILCLIRPEPASIYMVNRIHQSHPLKGVMMELPKGGEVGKRIWARIKQRDVGGLLEALRNRWYDRQILPQNRRIHHEVFGDGWQEISNDIPISETTDIHHPRIIEQIKESKPDLLLVHGTSILKESILSIPQYALNIHWGLSPHYRGVRCTEWALVNGDPFNIGVTVHELSAKIDGGKILAQGRPEVRAEDTSHSINMKLTHMGTDLLIQAISHLKEGKEWVFHPQNSLEGQLIQIRHWTKHHHRRLREIEQKGQLEDILRKPVKKYRVKIHPFSH